MILAIDAGNTRIKWGLWDRGAWLATGAVGRGEAMRLSEQWKPLPQPTRVVACNVAGEPIRSELAGLLSRWRVPVAWAASAAEQCGVRNGYRDPAQLGADRWVALIAARHLQSGAVLAVMCGTAITIDALTGDGRFLGGLILPGIEAMVESLNGRTAGVRVDHGSFELFPTSTRNAVWSAALQAAAGAVERMRAALEDHGERAPAILLSGGAAPLLEPLLAAWPVRRVDNLVLEGLRHLGES